MCFPKKLQSKSCWDGEIRGLERGDASVPCLERERGSYFTEHTHYGHFLFSFGLVSTYISMISATTKEIRHLEKVILSQLFHSFIEHIFLIIKYS